MVHFLLEVGWGYASKGVRLKAVVVWPWETSPFPVGTDSTRSCTGLESHQRH